MFRITFAWLSAVAWSGWTRCIGPPLVLTNHLAVGQFYSYSADREASRAVG